MKAPYLYNVTVTRVIDGDTIGVTLDLGFGHYIHDCRIRLRGIDAPERLGKKAGSKGGK